MAPDSAIIAPQETEADCALFKQLFNRLPPNVQSSFSAEQRAALAKAAEDCRRGQHQTDVRLSLPLLSKRYYLVLLAGGERRDRARRRAESSRHPFITGGNLLFLGATVTAATLLSSLLWTVGIAWYLAR